MSKRAKKQALGTKRMGWGINPVTRIKKDKTEYDRKSEKRALRKELKEYH